MPASRSSTRGGHLVERSLVADHDVEIETARDRVGHERGDIGREAVRTHERLLDALAREEVEPSEGQLRAEVDDADAGEDASEPGHRDPLLDRRCSADGLYGIDLNQPGAKPARETSDSTWNPEAWARHRDDIERRQLFRDFLFRKRMADGSFHYFRSSGKPFFNPAGNFLPAIAAPAPT